MISTHRIVYCLAIMSIALTTTNAMARNWKPGQWITNEEMAQQPEFCQVREGKRGKAVYNSYVEKYGQDFGHIHHYCYALIFISRYHGAFGDKVAKKSSAQEAIGNLDYVINHSNPNFSMLPDVYLDKGALLAAEGLYAAALTNIIKAIELKKDNKRAYGVIANVYISLKQTDKALSYVTEGLRYNPSSKQLRRQYLELGGKEPFPEPYKMGDKEEKIKATEGAATQEKNKPAETMIKPSTDISDQETLRGSNKAAPEKTNTPQVQEIKQTQEVKKEKFGTANNPWCRFCPEPVEKKDPAASGTATVPSAAQ